MIPDSLRDDNRIMVSDDGYVRFNEDGTITKVEEHVFDSGGQREEGLRHPVWLTADELMPEDAHEHYERIRMQIERRRYEEFLEFLRRETPTVYSFLNLGRSRESDREG